MNNDLVLYRYADVLLMKAEALWRLNPGDGTALMLVNEIRSRAGVDPFTFLDEENLLAERGREMFYENVRRQDLLRFEGLKGVAPEGINPWWRRISHQLMEKTYRFLQIRSREKTRPNLSSVGN